MVDDEKINPPTMDGYLEFRRRIEEGDPTVDTEVMEASFETPRPAIVHYANFMDDEQLLEEEGIRPDSAERAIQTGQIMAHLRELNPQMPDNELLFYARRRVNWSYFEAASREGDPSADLSPESQFEEEIEFEL